MRQLFIFAILGGLLLVVQRHPDQTDLVLSNASKNVTDTLHVKEGLAVTRQMTDPGRQAARRGGSLALVEHRQCVRHGDQEQHPRHTSDRVPFGRSLLQRMDDECAELPDRRLRSADLGRDTPVVVARPVRAADKVAK